MGIINRDGALWMATGIDNSGLYSGFNQAENRIDQFEAHIKRMGDNITRLTGVGLGVAGLKAFGSEIINVYGEMQMLQSSFEVLLGGKGVAGFTSELKKFAVDSPLSLAGVSQAAQTLLGFGIAADKVMPTIKQMGDISMGNEEKFKSLSLAFAQMSATGKLMGQDLLQMINAGFNPLMTISEKTGKSIGDLKKDMENGAISSQMVADAFASATAEGGKFYGMTQKQAEGIKGLQAQLEGGLQDAYNKIGESQNSLITGGYKTAISLVENYETIGKAILGLIATYGVYKAAVVFATQAEAGWNVVQLITYNRLLLVERAQKLLNATMLANPYVLVATVAIGLVTTMWALNDATTTQERAQKRLNDITEEAKQKKEDLNSESEQLIGTINSETKTIYDQIVAYKKLQGLFPDWLKNMSLAEFKALSLTEQQKQLSKAMNELDDNIATEGLRNQEKVIDDIKNKINQLSKDLADIDGSKSGGQLSGRLQGLREQLKVEEDVLESLKSQNKEREEARKEAEFLAFPEEEKKKIYKEQLSSLEKQKSLIESQIPNVNGINTAWNKLNPTFILLNNQLGDILSKIADTRAKLEDKPTSKNKSFWEKEKKDAEDALALMDESAKGSAEWKKQVDKLNTSKVKLGIWDFSGKSGKQAESAADKMREASLKLLNLQSELNNENAKQLLDHEQRMLDIEQDSFDKKERQNKLNQAKEMLSVDEYRQKMAKLQQEAAKDIYIKQNGSDKGLDFLKFNRSLLPDGLKDSDIEAQVKNMTDAIVAAYKKGNEDIAKEQKAFADEERLTFASQLDQQIYSIRTHYTERRLLAKGNTDLIKQINDSENREIVAARLQAHQKQLEADADYNQKYQQLIEDRFVFESDKQKASLEQQIEDQKKIFNNLEKQVFNDPNNDELARQLRDAYIQLKILNKELAKTPAQKLKDIAGVFSQISSELSSISGVDFSILNNAVSGIASFASGDFLGAASSGLGIVTNVITGIISGKERERQIQIEINKLQQQYNIDLRQQNYDLISSIDYARAFRDNLEALHWLIEKGFVSDVDYSAWEALNKQAQEANNNILAAQKSYDSVLSKANGTLNEFYNIRNSSDFHKRLLKDITEDWKNGTISIEEAFRRLSAKGFSGASETADEIARAKDETDKWRDQLVELSQQMDEFATGTTFDSFLSDASNAIKDFRGDISALADFTEDKLTNAILSSFKYQILSEALKPMYDELADMFLKGDFDSGSADDWKKRLTDILSTNSKELDKIFDAFGIDPEKSNTQASSKGIASMSQDSANELNGNFFALLQKTGDIRNINEASRVLLGGINNGVTDIQAIMRENNKVFQDSLEVQQKIEKNTARVAELLNRGINVTIIN